MRDSQSDRVFSMLEYAVVPVRATEFAEMETGLKTEVAEVKEDLTTQFHHKVF